LTLRVNGLSHRVSVDPGTPLLYVLREDLLFRGPKFGCGLAQCGACSVLLDGREIRSCVTPVGEVTGKSVTTLEGLPALWAGKTGSVSGALPLHPVQQAWIDVQVPQCGYCQNGMIIQTVDLLSGLARKFADVSGFGVRRRVTRVVGCGLWRAAC
jgi:isoquinoline 1-oxidoreductase alpha subunit